MKIQFNLCALFIIGLTAISCATVDRADNTEQAKIDGWNLFWSDEFSGSALDDATWSLCSRGRSDWNNTASNDPRLIELDHGVLRLRGIVNDDKNSDPAPYLTGAILSKTKFSYQYGKAQIRARFKCAQGAWPALWMMGEEKGWPACGEIDLMEHLNFDDIVYQTVHSEYTRSIDKTNTPKHGSTAKIERDEWNTYGCEWDADKIVFTVNGDPTFTYPRVSDKGEKQWPFKQAFYFLFSMQIGGDWVNARGEKPTLSEHYPAYMEIDWVRVYKPAN
ncbi:glycoside hydrolase family 16 protein [bacterium]|nr:glycoside hydrolase family 16 protein [bacterium]